MSKFKKILVCFLLLMNTILIFAQEWESIGPYSGRAFCAEWNPQNENEILICSFNVIFKSTDNMQSCNELFTFNSTHDLLTIITDIEYDNVNQNTIYLLLKDFSDIDNIGGIYKSTDGALSFTNILPGTYKEFCLNPQNGKIYVNTDNMIISSANQGSNWNYINVEQDTINKLVVSNNKLLITTNTGLYQSIDEGLTWSSLGFTGEKMRLLGVNPQRPNEIWTATKYRPGSNLEKLYKSIDSGSNWNEINLPYHDMGLDEIREINFSINPDFVQLAETNEVFVTDNSGLNWTYREFNISYEMFYPVDFDTNPFNDNESILVGDFGSIFTQNRFNSWDQLKLSAQLVNCLYLKPDFDYNSYLLFVGCPEGLKYYSSSANEWSNNTDNQNMGYHILSINSDYKKSGFLLQANKNIHFFGEIYKSMDNGMDRELVWDNDLRSGFIHKIQKSPNEKKVFYAISYPNPPLQSELIRTEDYGDTWEIIENSGIYQFAMTDLAVSYSDSSDIYLFGDYGVAKSKDRGETFIFKNTNLPSEMVSVGSISPFDDQLLIIGLSSGIYKSTNGGESWENINTMICNNIEFNPTIPGMVTVSSINNGTETDKVFISMNYGESWIEYGSSLPYCRITDLQYSPKGDELFIGTTTKGIFKISLDKTSVIPVNLNVSIDGYNAQLAWNEIQETDKYLIYRDGEVVGESFTNSFKDCYVINGEHIYQVSSVISEVESSLSEEYCFNMIAPLIDYQVNLYSTVINYNQVQLNWSEPHLIPMSNWVGYDNGLSSDNYSVNEPGNYEIAIKYNPADMDNWGNFVLSAIKFIPSNSQNYYRLKIYSGENAENLLIDQEISSVNENNWNYVYLDSTLTIQNNQTLWLALNIQTNNILGSYDNGLINYPGKSDLFKINNEWRELSDFGITANWNIKALVESENDYLQRKVIAEKMTRTFNSFNIYRDGELLSSLTDSLANSYLDINPGYGLKRYAITVRNNNIESSSINNTNIMVNDVFIAPKLDHYSLNNFSKIVLNWQAPVMPAEEEIISYGNTTPGGVYTAQGEGQVTMAVRFTAEQMTEYANYKLNKICFIPVNMCDYTLKVWKGDNFEEVYFQFLEGLSLNQINEIQLDSLIDIPQNEDLWIGFELYYFGGNIFTYDNTPTEAEGYSNLVKFNEQWSTLSALNINHNNIIYGKLVENSETRDNPVLIGYNIFRNNELIQTLNDCNIIEYTDQQINFDQEYTYSLKAIYENNHESQFSNKLTAISPTPYKSPVNLRAKYENNQIKLNWEMPFDIYNLHYGNGENCAGIGANNGNPMWVCVNFTPYINSDMNGKKIKRIRFFPRENHPSLFTIRNGEAFRQILLPSVLPMQWNEIFLEEGFAINASNQLEILWKIDNVSNTSFPFGVDNGQASYGHSDLVSYDGVELWSLNNYGFNCNVNIQAELVDEYNNPMMINYNIAKNLNNSDTKKIDECNKNIYKSGERSVSVVGFNVYRNNNLIHYSEGSTLRQYIDDNINEENNIYYLKTVYNDTVESPQSDTVNVTITNINDQNSFGVTKLISIYPNPFNPETTIKFSLSKEQTVNIDIYNIKGQKVKTLVSGTFSANNYSFVWNGTDDKNLKVSSGIYFCKMRTKEYSKVNKMLLLK